MIQALINIFRIPDLRNRVLFTLSMLIIYRIGFFIPLVGVDQSALAEVAAKASESAGGFGRFLDVEGKDLEGATVVIETGGREGWMHLIDLGARAVIFVER